MTFRTGGMWVTLRPDQTDNISVRGSGPASWSQPAADAIQVVWNS
jgi:hypothetical protein